MFSRFIALLFALWTALSLHSTAQGFDPFGGASKGKLKTESELFSTSKQITGGEPFEVILKLTHPKGWHSYYHNPGLGIPSVVPSIEWTMPDGFHASGLVWPIPHQSDFLGLKSLGYEETNYFLTTITPPDEFPEGKDVKLFAKASWQMCKESCINEDATFTLALATGEEALPDDARAREFADYAKTHLASSVPDAWKVTAQDDGDIITLTIKNAGALPVDLYFADYDGQVDAQVAQEYTSPEDGVWQLKVPRNKGTSLSDTPGPVLETLTGILSSKTVIPTASAHGVNISVAFNKATGAEETATLEETTEETPAVAYQETPADIESMRKLYFPESKINYITLNDVPKATLYSALFGAFIGGMLLNLMPCVFPVLGLKVMGFVEQAGNEPKKVRNHGLVFTLGVLVSMWILAGILLSLKLSLGKSVNWGAQMGNPYFVAGVVVLLFVLGLNMAGVFEMGTKLTGAGSDLQRKKGYSGSFFSGVLTTLIATPCSGPFLGAAMAYTLAQTAPVSMFLFSIFALGISSPYLVLSFFPALINRLPRPGAWMETFKVLMSFAMFGTAAFFLQSFGSQTGTSGLSWMIMGLVVLGLAAYCFGRWSLPHLKKSSRIWLGGVLPTGIAALSVWMIADAAGQEHPKLAESSSGHGWQQWRPGKVELSRSKGRIVWVDYTADW